MKIFLDANICLDLLDTTRPTSKDSVNWYLKHKDDKNKEFFFSGDFITTIFYVLTQRKNISHKEALKAIDLMSDEISPCYIKHTDYICAKNNLLDNLLNDLEDLIVLSSATQLGCSFFITNDKELLQQNKYKMMKIITPLEELQQS